MLEDQKLLFISSLHLCQDDFAWENALLETIYWSNFVEVQEERPQLEHGAASFGTNDRKAYPPCAGSNLDYAIHGCDVRY